MTLFYYHLLVGILYNKLMIRILNSFSIVNYLLVDFLLSVVINVKKTKV